jgi:hypothetical protein
MFAPSRAWLVGGSQNSVFHRQPRRMHDSLFVVANHGVLLEYILDPIPDSSESAMHPLMCTHQCG